MPRRGRSGRPWSPLLVVVAVAVGACGGSEPVAEPPRLTVLSRDGAPETGGVVAATTTTLVGTRSYTIEPGDTLAAIAAAQGTTVAAIVTLNRGIDATNLKVGSTLRLPPLPEAATTTTPTALPTSDGVTGATPQPAGPTNTTG